MPNSTTFNSSDFQNIAASGFLALASIFGLLTNPAAILCVYRDPVLKNGFGLLCSSHSMANLGVMLVFLLWVTPMTIMQSDLSTQVIGKIFGQVNILFWNVCVYSHLLISFNRLVVLTLPHKANDLFDIRKTLSAVVLIWTLGFCHIVPYFWRSECYIHYDATKWVFKFADTPCGSIISTYTDNYTSTTFMVVICMLDCTTLIKLRTSNNMLGTKKGNVSNYIQKKRRQNEIRFFMQTLYQNGLFLYEIVSFYYVSALFTNKWAVFITATLSWEMCHALDGFIVARFHFHLSYIGLKTKSSQATATSMKVRETNKRLTRTI